MTPEELFDGFPELLLSSFRDQMLLGLIPAETVELVLEPLLSNFNEIMLKIEPDLRTDFENILRIYPDVGDHFGVRVKPPIVESLKCLAQYRLGPDAYDARTGRQLDIAAEPQRQLDVRMKSFMRGGQGFFTSNKGRSVYLEFSYSEGGDCVSFEYRPPEFEIEIHICGIYAVTLNPMKPKNEIRADSLCEIVMKCINDVKVEVIDRAV